jgi:hypothetical protein
VLAAGFGTPGQRTFLELVLQTRQSILAIALVTGTAHLLTQLASAVEVRNIAVRTGQCEFGSSAGRVLSANDFAAGRTTNQQHDTHTHGQRANSDVHRLTFPSLNPGEVLDRPRPGGKIWSLTDGDIGQSALQSSWSATVNQPIRQVLPIDLAESL